MTKLLYSLSLVFAFTTLFGQTTINVLIIDQSTGLPAVNHFVALNLYATPGNPPQNPTADGYTNQNGIFTFGYASNINGTHTLAKASYDCNNQYVADTSILALSGGTFVDTLNIACMPAGGLNCVAGITTAQDTGNPMALNFTLDTSLLSGLPPNPSVFAGDWTISEENPHFVIDSLYAIGQININYIFPSPGKYSICHLYAIWDSTLLATRPCLTMVCDTVTLPFTSFCNASYYLDTNNSNSDILQVVNTSGPKGSFYTNTYFWDFGDGNTSTLPYPTNIYSTAGAYNVCVTITSTDGFQNVCTSTFCDTIGVDSTGQVIYKNGQKGFTLRVIDPNSIGIDEITASTSFTLFPNPANSEINLKMASSPKGKTTIEVYDIFGRMAKQSSLENIPANEAITLKVDDLPSGFYLLKVSSALGQSSIKRFEVINR